MLQKNKPNKFTDSEFIPFSRQNLKIYLLEWEDQCLIISSLVPGGLWGYSSGGYLRPESRKNSSLSSKSYEVSLSIALSSNPLMSPAPNPMPSETPTYTSSHPAASTFVIRLLKRVGSTTSQLQQVLITVGAMKKVPKKLMIRKTMELKLSRVASLFKAGQSLESSRVPRKPANSPQAMAAPMLQQVPATEPYIIAPRIVPISDCFTPNRLVCEKSTAEAQEAITLALRAKKVPKKASGHTKLRANSLVAFQYLGMYKVVETQKAKKRKKVPICAKIAERSLYSFPCFLEALWTRDEATRAQAAPKRQTLLIKQSSNRRLSGLICSSNRQRQWLRFQAKLQSRDPSTICEGLSRPKRASRPISWEMELARDSLRLKKSMLMSSPPKLKRMKRSGPVELTVPPWKLVMKTLNQNFCRMGERITVKETMKMLVNSAVTVAFLKQDSSSPKPMTVKTAVKMKRFPQMVCVEKLTGVVLPVARRTSLAHPQTHRIPNMMTSTMAPAARLLILVRLLEGEAREAAAWGEGVTWLSWILVSEWLLSAIVLLIIDKSTILPLIKQFLHSAICNPPASEPLILQIGHGYSLQCLADKIGCFCHSARIRIFLCFCADTDRGESCVFLNSLIGGWIIPHPRLLRRPPRSRGPPAAPCSTPPPRCSREPGRSRFRWPASWAVRSGW